jgi:hypothetical protein
VSPRTGGETAKFGDRFEGRWTVSWMVEVLYERADAIVVEPIDELRHTVEFEVRRDGRKFQRTDTFVFECAESGRVRRTASKDANWASVSMNRSTVSSSASVVPVPPTSALRCRSARSRARNRLRLAASRRALAERIERRLPGRRAE